MRLLAVIALLMLALPGRAALDERLEGIDLLRLSGDYRSAIALTRVELDQDPGNPRLEQVRGELLLATGELDAAAVIFDRLGASPGPERLSAWLKRAEIHRQRGEIDAAEKLWRGLREAYQTAQTLSARDLFSIADATRELGRGDPQLFKDAVWLYDQAKRKDPALLDAGIAQGELLLEKYNSEEASAAFREVLEVDDDHPRALLGLARSQHFDYSTQAVSTVQEALSLNPNLVPARIFAARLHVEVEQYAEAQVEVEAALGVNPVSLEALAMQGAIAWLEHDAHRFDTIEAKILALNPRYAEFYATLAELAAQNRLYREAEDFASRAVELDAQSWRGHGLLGMNRLRLGQIDAGRASLETSFAGDPYNAWIKNTLQLADSFADYVEIDRGRFRIVLHNDEDALLGEYIHELTAQAYQHFAKRYRHEPDGPIRVELYPDHDDFSVRSVGMAGVGLLGVAFGPVVAMDSPAARSKSEFNWGSTLWHELAHVFHLSMTANRVPRWVSEGLAVHEEREARPGWGGDVDPDFLLAWLGGRLLPVSQLNNGFVRPEYPEQVLHSYFQASLVFDFIEERWGFDVIRQALVAYRDSPNPNIVLPQQLGLDSSSLDAAFDDYLRARYAGPLAALSRQQGAGEQPLPVDPAATVTPESADPDNYYDQVKLGIRHYEQEEYDLAEPYLLRAQQLFPEYAGTDSSYWLLGLIYRDQGRLTEAAAQFARMIAINAENYPAQTELGLLRQQLGDTQGAIDALEAALYIYPYDFGLHRRLAEYYAEFEKWNLVARERRALLALDPVDRAEAHYQLAAAYEKLDNRFSAREQILYALEIAPNYARAQDLLLALWQQRAGGEKP
jgi:tetratricopeptide (TPR) repeat protein